MVFWIIFLETKVKIHQWILCMCPRVREMVSVQVNRLKYKLNQNRKNSQRSSSDYCNLTRLKDDIDRLLLGPGHDRHKYLLSIGLDLQDKYPILKILLLATR